MTSVLGKRKSRREEKDPAEVAAAQEKLRKLFESKFEPITPTTDTKDGEVDDERSDESGDDDEDGDSGSENEGGDSEDDDDEWGGLSGDEDTTSPQETETPQIEVVDYTTTTTNPTSSDPTLRKAERAYLSSRVPSALPTTAAAPAKQSSKKTADEDATTLLRDDMALQRLLTESHLFDSTFGANAKGTGIEHEGRNRHKATDLRLASLGSKDSIYKQAKMPMSHRKGIIAAAEKREEKRRREARENGIVLERATTGVHEGWTGLKGKKSKSSSSGGGAGGSRKREAAVDAPAVGKLRNGLLQLSKKDIREIEGSGGGSSRGGKGGGKKRRR
ncbi:hypothetical protein PG993_013087 [Apiospora rasikravindrae]|uniref:Uncharacterized protein n=1 Tax=Apiospora rasikravindrae TaxID=990691 RepID=A0ABR1RWM6_9PEZI